MPAFHGIMVVQDEGDIIEECLRDASQYLDRIFVYDTGSIDGTKEIIKNIENFNNKVTVIHEKPTHFHEFETRRHAVLLSEFEFSSGDWIIILDGDEFFGIDPREFIATFGSKSDFVRHRHYNFAPTNEFMERDSGKSFRRSDFTFYRRYEYSEIKMFRYRNGVGKAMAGRGPRWLGRGCRHRLPILHYPHRSELQMRRRFALRTMAKAAFPEERWGTHWSRDDIGEFLIEPGSQGTFEFDGETVSRDLQREDGLLDTRLRGASRQKAAIKRSVQDTLTRMFGNEPFDAIYGWLGDAGYPQPVEKTPEWQAEYRALLEAIQERDPSVPAGEVAPPER